MPRAATRPAALACGRKHARTLGQLADPRRFPAIARFAAAGVSERSDPPEKEFTFGLERMLDGIADLIRERA